MNYKNIFNVLGYIFLIVSGLILIPLVLSFAYGDNIHWAYITTIVIFVFLSVLCLIKKSKVKSISVREGFVIVGLAWVTISVVSAFIYYLSGFFPNFFDALFETVSGFSTTGASILQNIEILPKSILFWRCFTIWIGGIGILIFALAILPSSPNTVNILKSEATGPQVGKLVSKVKYTAQILYIIYIIMTITQTFLLSLSGIGFFDSLLISFSNAGTGGFANLNASIGGYNNIYVEIICTMFMFLYSINFNLFYLILIGKSFLALKSEELKYFISFIIVGIVAITLNLTFSMLNFWEALRVSIFQVVSTISETGFTITNMGAWPIFSKVLICVFMFVGACAGSTGGGFKVSRFLILSKSTFQSCRSFARPNQIENIKFENKIVESKVLEKIHLYLVFYIFTLIFSTMVLLICNLPFEDSFTSALTAISNCGPSFASTGTYVNFSTMPNLAKSMLSINMLVGRLEFFPILLLMMPSTWRKR